MKILEEFIQKYLVPRGLPESLIEFKRKPDSDNEHSSDWDDIDIHGCIQFRITIKGHDTILLYWEYSFHSSWAVKTTKYAYYDYSYGVENTRCNIDVILDEVAKQYKLQQAYDATLAEIAELKAKILEMELRPGGREYENAKAHFENITGKKE